MTLEELQPHDSPVLDSILEVIKTTPVDFDRISKEARKKEYHADRDAAANLPGLFLELHLNLLLSVLALSMVDQIALLNEPKNYQTSKFILQVDPNHSTGLTIINRKTGNMLAQYDHLLKVREEKKDKFQLAIFEAKMARRGSTTLRYAVNRDKYRKRVKYVSELFYGTLVHYILVLAKDSLIGYEEFNQEIRIARIPISNPDFLVSVSHAWAKNSPGVHVDSKTLPGL